MVLLSAEDRKLMATVKPEYAKVRYLKKGDVALFEQLKKHENENNLQDNSHGSVTKTSTKTIELNNDIFELIEHLQKQRNLPTLSDVITELHNSYPWHVMACEIDQKRLFDEGVVITTKEDLTDALNKERAKFYVMGKNNYQLNDLPEEVRGLINVK